MEMPSNNIFNLLNNAIIETQVNGKDILYFSGKFAGYEYMKRFKGNVMNIKGIEKTLKNALKKLSIGSIESIAIEDNKILIKINKCAFCEKNKINPKVKCYFLVGFIAGVLSRILNYNFYRFSGKEIKCKNHGNKDCIFEITSI